jgi:hypothetical protein
MENLSPHRRFRGCSNYEPSFQPMYRHPWPKDLPAQCSMCGTAFIMGFNLTTGPSRASRFLKIGAMYAIIPCWLGALILPRVLYPALKKFGLEDYSLLPFFPLIFTPAIMVFLSVILPNKRRLECKKCGWDKYYKTSPPPDLSQYSNKN